ncbi:hypothetical protein ACP26L_25740 [Paenibacillus sp. S-38]|uniref:hypothetical protein n=1 Tax=Paenibacillus sp. S-38 TaxID=3416710 RepID=UPI003CFB507D
MDPNLKAAIKRVIDDLETKARRQERQLIPGESVAYANGFMTGKMSGMMLAVLELEKVLQDA